MLYPALLTLAAWLVGLFIDANTFSDAYIGFLQRRDKGERP